MSAVTPTPPALRVLSVIPPMTHISGYPSWTAYLTGFAFARSGGCGARPGAGLVLRLLSPRRATRHCRQGGCAAAQKAQRCCTDRVLPSSKTAGPRHHRPPHHRQGFAQKQGATALAPPASSGRHYLPEGPRFASLDVYVDDDEAATRWAGHLAPWALTDKDQTPGHAGLNDLADVLRDAVDRRFEFVRYAESLAGSHYVRPLANAWLRRHAGR